MGKPQNLRTHSQRLTSCIRAGLPSNKLNQPECLEPTSPTRKLSTSTPPRLKRLICSHKLRRHRVATSILLTLHPRPGYVSSKLLHLHCMHCRQYAFFCLASSAANLYVCAGRSSEVALVELKMNCFASRCLLVCDHSHTQLMFVAECGVAVPACSQHPDFWRSCQHW